jgi:hypothetical protein
MVIFCRLKYWDLGRGKAKGQVDIFGRDEADVNNQIFKEFSKHLVSNDIWFENGIINAGLHSVGKYEFIAKYIVGEKNG